MLHDQRGTVSLYLLAITAGVLFFMGMLVDYARIFAFRNQLEATTSAALRSSLSAFDRTLLERYELFGGGGTNRNELLTHTLTASTSSIVQTKIEHTKVNVSATLGEFAVFEQQVLEAMKYKAPIDLTLEIMQAFNKLRPSLTEGVETADNFEQLASWMEQRDRLLDEIKRMQQTLGTETFNYVNQLRLDLDSLSQQQVDMLRHKHDHLLTTCTSKLEQVEVWNERIRKLNDKLALTADGLSTLQSHFSEQTQRFATLRLEAISLLADSRPIEEQADQVAQLWTSAAQYLDRFGPYGEVIQRYEFERTQRQNHTATAKQQGDQAQTSWSEMRAKVQGLTSGMQLDEHQKQYNEVAARVAASLHYNNVNQEGSGATLVPAEVERVRTTSLDSIKKLVNDASEKLYMNEYVSGHFTAFDPQQWQAMIENHDVAQATRLFQLHNQEQEFIIYGLTNPAGNVAAAFAEWLSIKFAIRFIEGIAQSARLLEPLTVLASASLYAVNHVAQDLTSLLATGRAPLSRYVPIELTYQDYLRLFMMLHPATEHRLARTIAIIEQNVGFTLAQRPTSLTARVDASMKLWFIPWGRGGLSRYGNTKTFGLGYE